MRKKSKVYSRYKSKHKRPAVAPVSDDDALSDRELSDADLELLQEYGSHAGFLRDLNATALIKNQVATNNPGTIRRLKTNIDTSADDSEDDCELVVGDEVQHDSDLSEYYENVPRVLKNDLDDEQDTAPKRLPAFGEDGKLIRLDEPKKVLLPREELAAAKEKQKAKIDAAASVAAAAANSIELVKKPKGKKDQGKKNEVSTQADPKKMSPQMRIQARWDAQEILAELASSVIESPEEHIGNIKQMRQLGENRDSTIQKFAILSQLTVFRDIIPGYRIRTLSDEERQVQVSKDVKKLRMFEEALLQNYQAYLQQLETLLRRNCGGSGKGNHVDSSVAIVAMQCMSELLTTVTHFNFRVNLLTMIVSKMGSKSPVEVGAIACNALCKLFDEDISGEPSLEAVKLIARMIKNKEYKVDEMVLKTFLHLRLKDEMSTANGDTGTAKENDSKKRKKDKNVPHVSKKMRKVEKKDLELEGELKEAEATYSREEKQKNHSETLKFVFLTYFRILKNAETSPLIPGVLEGLSHFGHLINVDFFADILAVLKKITISQYQQYAEGKNPSSAKTSLHCIVSALLLMSGQGEAVNIDLKDFNTSLYSQMSQLPMTVSSSDPRIMDGAEVDNIGVEKDSVIVKRMSDVHSRSEIELVLMGLDILFCRKKQIQVDRAAAFIKRLASVSLHLKPNAVLACLSLQRALLVKHTRLQQLLDPEERLGTGVYKPYLDDAELCNPFATNLWELSLLMNHYYPTIRTFARHVASTETTTTASVTGHKSLPPDLNLNATQFLKKYDTNPEYPTPTFRFIPAVVEPVAVTKSMKRRFEMTKERYMKPIVDGPAVIDPSEFLNGLQKQEEADEGRIKE